MSITPMMVHALHQVGLTIQQNVLVQGVFFSGVMKTNCSNINELGHFL